MRQQEQEEKARRKQEEQVRLREAEKSARTADSHGGKPTGSAALISSG